VDGLLANPTWPLVETPAEDVGAEPTRSVAEAAATTATAPAGWYADPTGRYELRYWDGSRWTDQGVNRAFQ
jgi:Protein of unknown function (DUF2510)